MVIMISPEHRPLLDQTGVQEHPASFFGCKTPTNPILNSLKAT